MSPLLFLTVPAYAQDLPPEPAPIEAPLVDTFVPPSLLSIPEVPWPGGDVDHADVGMRLTLDATGAVTAVEVTRPAGPPFDDAARGAVLAARFEPAHDETGPISVIVEFTYAFERPPPPPPPMGELAGEVLEKGTGEPVAGARVRVTTPGGSLETTTDARGAWRLPAVPVGEVQIQVVNPGYDDATTALAVREEEEASVRLYARNRAYGETEAVGVYTVEQPPTVTRRTLTIDETRRVPGTFGDVVRVIPSLPGATTASFSQGGGLVLRGSNPANSKVYVDGVEIPLIYHLGNFRSVINSDLVSSVDYYPGSFGVRYGRGTGGVVDIKTSDEYPNRWRGTWQTDFIDTSVFSQGKIGAESKNPVGVSLALRRSYLDLWLPALIPPDAPTINPRWLDWQVRVDDLRGAGRWMLFAYGSDDRLFITSDSGGEPDLSTVYGTTRFVGRWRSDPTREVRGFVQPWVGTDSIDLGLSGEGIEVTSRSLRFGLRAEVEAELVPALVAAAGLDGDLTRRSSTWKLPDLPRPSLDPFAAPVPVSIDSTLWTFSADPYVELRLRPLADRERLLISLGARGETYGIPNEGAIATIDPRLIARFDVGHGFVLKGGSGLYQQTVSQQTADAAAVLELPFERAWSSEVGFEQDLGRSASFDLTGYYKAVDRIAVNNPAFRDLETDPLYVPDGVGQTYGLEALLRKRADGPLFGWLAYTLSRSERRDSPTDPNAYPFAFDQTHNLVALGGYRFPYDLELSARTQYITGGPFTPEREGAFDLDVAGYSPTSAATNSDRLPPYWTVDLRISKLWTWNRVQLSTYADVLGILQGTNPQSVLYAYDSTESIYVAGLPTIPSLGFELKGAF